ncbi:MAG: Lrp/AsnC family transcriptional regulator [Archaeoglobaceae archaeon]
MDEIDKRILHILQENDKVRYHEIGKKLDIGASTVHYRIKKLSENGVIKSFSAIIDPKVVGYDTTAWLGLSVDPTKMDEIAQKLAKYDEVQIVTTATGDHDLLVQIIARDEKELWRFINENIKPMEGVKKDFDVSTFLDEYKRSHFTKL